MLKWALISILLVQLGRSIAVNEVQQDQQHKTIFLDMRSLPFGSKRTLTNAELPSGKLRLLNSRAIKNSRNLKSENDHDDNDKLMKGREITDNFGKLVYLEEGNGREFYNSMLAKNGIMEIEQEINLLNDALNDDVNFITQIKETRQELPVAKGLTANPSGRSSRSARKRSLSHGYRYNFQDSIQDPLNFQFERLNDFRRPQPRSVDVSLNGYRLRNINPNWADANFVAHNNGYRKLSTKVNMNPFLSAPPNKRNYNAYEGEVTSEIPSRKNQHFLGTSVMSGRPPIAYPLPIESSPKKEVKPSQIPYNRNVSNKQTERDERTNSERIIQAEPMSLRNSFQWPLGSFVSSYKVGEIGNTHHHHHSPSYQPSTMQKIRSSSTPTFMGNPFFSRIKFADYANPIVSQLPPPQFQPLDSIYSENSPSNFIIKMSSLHSLPQITDLYAPQRNIPWVQEGDHYYSGSITNNFYFATPENNKNQVEMQITPNIPADKLEFGEVVPPEESIDYLLLSDEFEAGEDGDITKDPAFGNILDLFDEQKTHGYKSEPSSSMGSDTILLIPTRHQPRPSQMKNPEMPVTSTKHIHKESADSNKESMIRKTSNYPIKMKPVPPRPSNNNPPKHSHEDRIDATKESSIRKTSNNPIKIKPVHPRPSNKPNKKNIAPTVSEANNKPLSNTPKSNIIVTSVTENPPLTTALPMNDFGLSIADYLQSLSEPRPTIPLFQRRPISSENADHKRPFQIDPIKFLGKFLQSISSRKPKLRI